MVQTSHPVWGNRSCLRFGIYSDTLDEDATGGVRARDRRLRVGIVAGMLLVTTLLVTLLVVDVVGGYGPPRREKDAVQHLLMLRATTEPSVVQVSTVATTHATSTTHTSTEPTTTASFQNLSEALPYSAPEVRFSNRKYGRVLEKEPYPVYWTPEPTIQSRIMNRARVQEPRPFRARNTTATLKKDSFPYYSLSKYPQLTSYRYPNEAKNIQDIIKYLTDETSPSNKQQETIAGRKIKFAGVYKTGAEQEDSYSRPDESVEEVLLAGNQNKMSDPSLNGHAYIADPFHAYKPADPSEVNLLANSDFRFSPIRFASRPHGTRWGLLDVNPNDKYFPRPPINFGKPIPTQTEHHEPVVQMYPGTYTSAIYRPFGKEPAKKPKPLSVMLDIYPMAEDGGHQQATQLRPTRHRSRPPHAGPSGEAKHQMIVHLNLYPKKKTPGFASRSFHVDVQSNAQCCEDEVLRRVYEDAVDDSREDPAPWRQKQESFDFIQPRGRLTSGPSAEQEVTAGEEESLSAPLDVSLVPSNSSDT
ncbi:uncharacterized protein [Periplaneta americana]|uniref:uncharacterized protein n=1 Tax=Periplaneta americana TaxID=6978 RepID=UPI0037E9A81D